MIKGLKVIGSRLIVKEVEAAVKTKAGIILTSANQERTYTGSVLVVGDGTYLENGSIKPLTVKVGDQVIFAKFSGTPITYKDEQYIILNERDVLLIIDGEQNGEDSPQ